MFSNDGSFRRYIAKGPNQWEFFTDSENLENFSIILDRLLLPMKIVNYLTLKNETEQHYSKMYSKELMIGTLINYNC